VSCEALAKQGCKRPWKLVWYCVFTTKKQAIDFEMYLKQGSGFAFARKHLT
jgi:predicted GIY-YIG superfamily endonuclease